MHADSIKELLVRATDFLKPEEAIRLFTYLSDKCEQLTALREDRPKGVTDLEVRPGAVFTKSLSKVLGLSFAQKYKQGIYLFGVLHRWKGRGNQYIQLVKVLYCKLPTNSK